MSSLLTIKPPPAPTPEIQNWWRTVQRYLLAEGDIRNPQSKFASGVVADPTTGTVTLGTTAVPSGRTAAIPTLFGHMNDSGRAADQRFYYPVTVANRNSAQNTASILTSTSGATTSTVSVASHSVKFDFGTISYNSGTVSGLTPSTDYYVYALDPNFAGGAVSYYATTNPTNLISSSSYYVGAITTAIAGTGFGVSAASLANPTEITTASAHGWTTGNTVTFATMDGGFTALNGNNYSITVTSTTKFTIAVNATLFAAYSGAGGIATRVSGSTSGGGGGGGGGGGKPWA